MCFYLGHSVFTAFKVRSKTAKVNKVKSYGENCKISKSANALSTQGLKAPWLIDSNGNARRPPEPIANLTFFTMTQFFLQ